MVTIQLDDNTAKALERQAQDAGMSLVEYLRSLAGATLPHGRPNWDDIEKEISALSTSGPSLPENPPRSQRPHAYATCSLVYSQEVARQAK